MFLRMLEVEESRFKSDGFNSASAVALLDRVDGWLTSHICRIDVKLRDAPA
jgi:hemerythrin